MILRQSGDDHTVRVRQVAAGTLALTADTHAHARHEGRQWEGVIRKSKDVETGRQRHVRRLREEAHPLPDKQAYAARKRQKSSAKASFIRENSKIFERILLFFEKNDPSG
ncbi:hypothetical protein J8I29_23170 [Labrys sp. LIt4]|uniref:hypothetical protein n=1 Tax=Labrys sp. LIt4 TaxID=2821355 RepID=UPI001ADFD059|nr:hypothetical protein [Labrys sp. LIt4]MBP0582246.1 hypothetical protein [Labrys sp. LIt4]